MMPLDVVALVRGMAGAIGDMRRYRAEAPPNEPRELHRSGKYRVIAWLEYPTGQTPRLYVRVEQTTHHWELSEKGSPTPARRVNVWQHVRTWTDVRLDRQPWWNPWARRRELQAVVHEAIVFVEHLAQATTSAEVTLEAVAEAMQVAAGGS